MTGMGQERGRWDASQDNVETRKQCADCKAWSPPSDANSTMVSVKHGWRLAPWRDENGRNIGQWRCPACWKKFREAQGKSGR
jgi:hypothetical protein